MSDETERENLRQAIARYGAEIDNKNKALLNNPNAREQELLDALLQLGKPLTQFQEEWLNETYRDLSRDFRNVALDHAKITLGIGDPDDELDRFQIATIRLIETIHGYFAGSHAVNLIDSARAACEVISGFTNDLQSADLLPKDMPRIYKSPKEVTEGADEQTLISADMHRASRAKSNASKHADRDARKVLSYSDTTNLQHLMYSMAQDYETLHCELLRAGLLSTDFERLYPVERSTLVQNGHSYKKLYAPKQTKQHTQNSLDESGMASIFLEVINQFDASEVHVPAATLACLLFSKDGLYARHSPQIKNTILETFRDHRIWPITVSSNARVVRDPNILYLDNDPAP